MSDAPRQLDDRVRLDSICSIVQGGRHKLSGKHFIDDGGYPAYGAGGHNGNLPSYEFDKPGIVLSAIGARCGKCFQPAGRWSSLANTSVFFPDENRVDIRFLWYQLNDELSWHRSGTAQPYIKPSDIKGRKVHVPPLKKQKRIAAILDAADDLRAKRRESLAELDALIQSTFLEMFGDPVTNPMGWEVVKFETLGTSRLGKMLDNGKQTGDCQSPYLANFNVQWGRFELNELRQMDFDAADREEFQLRDGDLLVCEGGEVGRTAIWREELDGVYFQKALHRVRLAPTRAVPEYIMHYMWFMAQNGGFRDFTNAATIAHLTGIKLKSLPTPLPPLDLQHQFAEIVQSIERQRAKHLAHSDELDTLFASLQSRAFKGEL